VYRPSICVFCTSCFSVVNDWITDWMSEWMSEWVNEWCSAAFQAQVASKETLGDWTRTTVNVMEVFKAGSSRVVQGEQLFVWSLSRNVAANCRCPNLRPRRVYLLMGRDDHKAVGASAGRGGVVINRSSVVARWRSKFARKLRQFAADERLIRAGNDANKMAAC